MLVVQIAHDRLQQVLHGYHAFRAAVFVYDDGQVHTRFLKCVQQVGARHTLGHIQHASHVFFRRGVGISARLKQGDKVFYEHSAHDIVQVLFIYRDARETVFRLQRHDVLQRGRHGHAHHIGAVRHDLGHLAVVELEDVFDHLVLAFVHGACLLASLHHHQNIFLRHRLLITGRADAQRTQHKVGGRGDQLDDGLAHLVQRPYDAHDLERHAVRILHSDALGRKLAENQHEIRKNNGNEKHRHAAQRRRGNGNERQRGDQWVREAVRGCGRSQKAGQRNAHLNGGQEVRRSLGDDEQTRGGLAAALGQALHLLCVDGHHRKLAHGEKRVGGNEYDLQK